jgi:hypothetical protein
MMEINVGFFYFFMDSGYLPDAIFGPCVKDERNFGLFHQFVYLVFLSQALQFLNVASELKVKFSPANAGLGSMERLSINRDGKDGKEGYSYQYGTTQ